MSGHTEKVPFPDGGQGGPLFPARAEALDALQEPAVLLDVSGTIQMVNSTFCRVFAIAPENSLGHCLLALPGLVRPQWSAAGATAIDTSSLHMTAHATDNPLLVMVTISPESYVRRMVREADALIAVAENSPDFIGITDLEGNPIFLNAAGRALVGLADDDAVNRAKIEDYYYPEDWKNVSGNVDHVIREGIWTGEVTMRHFQTGERIPIYGSLFSLRDPRSGQPFALAAVVRDIREQKLREAEQTAATDRQARIARTLQNALLMIPAPEAFRGMTFTPLYRPALDEALVGGDFYDAFAVCDGVVALIVGDATGKGLNAATYTAEIRFALRAFLREHGSPGIALTLLNNFVAENDRLDREHLGGSYVAVAVVLIDTVHRIVSCSTAGAEAPLLCRAKTGEVEEIVAGGPILGVFPDSAYQERQALVESGDLVVLATDGITEARLPGTGAARAFFGQEGLIESVRKAGQTPGTLRDMGESILADTMAWSGGEQHDDICLLLARIG